MTGNTGIERELPVAEDPGTQGLEAWRWIYPAFLFFLPLVAVVASRGVVVLLVAGALLAVVAAWRLGLGAPWRGLDRGLAMGLGMLVLWSAIASLWGFDPPRTLKLSLQIAGLFAAALVLHDAFRRADPAARGQMGPCLIAGLCAALGLVGVELLFGFPIGQVVRGATELGADEAVWLNRGATALAILCWPAAGYLWGRRAKLAAFVLLAVTLGMLSALSSLSAVVGLLAGALVALAALLRAKAGRPVIAAATLAVMAGSPIAAHQLYDQDWQSAQWLPFSAQHRVEIWHFTAERIAEKPLAGWGFGTARDLGRTVETLEPSGRSLTSLHPHNAPLQILLELGLAGAAIVLALAWMLIQRLERLPPGERAFGQATYAATLVIACTAYGLWQNQWLALMACAAIAVAATAGPARRAPAAWIGAPGTG